MTLENVLPWLGLVGGIFGVAGVFGAAYAVLRANVSDRTIGLWRGQAEALESSLAAEKGQRATERAALEARVTATEAHASACEERLATLEGIVADALKVAPATARARARKAARG